MSTSGGWGGGGTPASKEFLLGGGTAPSLEVNVFAGRGVSCPSRESATGQRS